jgi:hypothetical protein
MGFLSLVSLFDVGMKATTLTGRSSALFLTPASSDIVMPSLVDEEEVKERTLDSEQEEEEDEQEEPALPIQTLKTTQSVTKSCSTEITATTMAAESKQSPSDSVQADPLGALATAALADASASEAKRASAASSPKADAPHFEEKKENSLPVATISFRREPPIAPRGYTSYPTMRRDAYPPRDEHLYHRGEGIPPHSGPEHAYPLPRTEGYPPHGGEYYPPPPGYRPAVYGWHGAHSQHPPPHGPPPSHGREHGSGYWGRHLPSHAAPPPPMPARPYQASQYPGQPTASTPPQMAVGRMHYPPHPAYYKGPPLKAYPPTPQRGTPGAETVGTHPTSPSVSPWAHRPPPHVIGTPPSANRRGTITSPSSAIESNESTPRLLTARATKMPSPLCMHGDEDVYGEHHTNGRMLLVGESSASSPQRSATAVSEVRQLQVLNAAGLLGPRSGKPQTMPPCSLSTVSNKRRASMGKWSEDEDNLLRQAVSE